MDRKKVYVCVPVHGAEVNVMTLMSVWDIRRSRHDVAVEPSGLSLLARNFNINWIKAFNGGFDYFVMLHADVAPIPESECWVDRLVAVCARYKAAVVSEVLPIKSPEGTTSTGLITDATNPFSLRRLTTTEFGTLPDGFICREDLCDVFGVFQDVAGPLLINTGLMCIDLRAFDWAGLEFPGFGIDDEIFWNRIGAPQAYTQPEDWKLSFWLFEQGLPYYALKSVPALHCGFKPYHNREAFGLPTDNRGWQPSIEDYVASE